MARSVFFVSDGTGITAETVGRTLLTQFEALGGPELRTPFVNSEQRAREVIRLIDFTAQRDGEAPIVFQTIVDQKIAALIGESKGFVVDVFAGLLSPLETELGFSRSSEVGRAHGMNDTADYELRMDATNYALTHDDGIESDYEHADVVLIGVSRSGKTPTCLYMALQHGVLAANYPITDEDFDQGRLPERLLSQKSKLFGLTIDPRRLAQIREIRRPNSRYASLRKCQREVSEAEGMFRRYGIPTVSTTHASVEELSSKVMMAVGLGRGLA